jgi:hypothetical protein
MGKPRRFGFSLFCRKILVRTRDIDVFLFAGKSEQLIPKKKIGMISPLNYFISAVAVVLGSVFGFFKIFLVRLLIFLMLHLL